jgi:hypothetical protein
MYNARVGPDSLAGLVRRQGSFQPLSVSRADVRGIQLSEFDDLRTLGLVGVIVGGVLWIIGRGIREGYTT